jgi:hypothetical protein
MGPQCRRLDPSAQVLGRLEGGGIEEAGVFPIWLSHPRLFDDLRAIHVILVMEAKERSSYHQGAPTSEM